MALATWGASLPVSGDRAATGSECYTFTTNAFGVYGSRLVQQSTSWSALTTVYDATNTAIWNNWNSGFGTFTLKASTTYTFEVSGSAGSNPSGYHLGVFELSSNGSCATASSTHFGNSAITGTFVDGTEVTCRQLADPPGSVYRAGTQAPWGRLSASIYDAQGALVCSWGAASPSGFSDCALTGAAPYHLLTRSSDGSDGFAGTYSTWLDEITSGAGCSSGTVSTWDSAPGISVDRATGAADCVIATSVTFGHYLMRLTQDNPNWSARIAIYEPGGTRVYDSYSAYTGVDLKGNMAYRFVVTGDPNGYPPHYRLAVTQVSGTGTSCPAAAATTWDSPGTPVSLATGTEFDCRQLGDAAGSTVRMTIGSSAILDVYNASGVSVCQYYGSYSSSADCNLTGAGPFRVVSRSGSSPSDYAPVSTTLWANNVATTVGCGSGALATWDQQLPISISRSSHAADCVVVTTNAFGNYFLRYVQDNGNWSGTVTVYDPNGTQVSSSTSSYVELQLKGATNYLLIFSGSPNGYPPGMHAGLFDYSAGGCPSLSDTSWSASAVVDSYPHGTEVACDAIATASGTTVRLTRRGSSSGLSVVSFLYDGSGNQVCSLSGDSDTFCTLTGSGPYRILSRSGWSSSDAIVGTTSIWVSDLSSNTGCTSIDATIPVPSTSAPGALASNQAASCWTSGLAREDRARLSISSATSSPLSATVISVNGTSFCSVYGTQSTTDCALTSSGPYKVLVVGAPGDTSGYRVALRRLNNPLGCQHVEDIASGISGVNGTVPTADSLACVQFTTGVGDQMNFNAYNPSVSGQPAQNVDVYQPNGDALCSPRPGYPSPQCSFTIEGSHTAVVSPVTPGKFVFSSTCVNPACGPDVFALASVTPQQVGNGGSTTVTVRGKALDVSDTVTAIRGGTTVTGRPLSVSADGREMPVVFDLSAAPFGIYDIRVTSPRDGAQTAQGALTVGAIQPPHLDTGVVALGRFVAGRPQTVSVTVTNTGNVDALGAPLVVGGFPAGTVVTPKFDLVGASSVNAPVQPSAWAPARSVYTDAAGTSGVPLFLGRIPPGGSHQYDFSVTVPVASDYDLTATSSDCMLDSSQPGANDTWGGGGCGDAVVDLATGFIPGGPCLGTAIDAGIAISRNVAQNAPPFAATSDSDMLWSAIGGVSCVASLIPGGQIVSGILDGIAHAKDFVNAGKKCFGGASAHQRSVSSLDPNELVGPTGGGDAHATTTASPHTFAVYFENSRTATAPAQEVTVVDYLDPNQYDLNTLHFGAIQFGNTRWTPASAPSSIDHTLDLGNGLQLAMTASATNQGAVTWHLNTQDVLTGAVPADPNQGFLPPDTDGTVGQAVLYFDVQPKQVADGTILSSRADVTFDLNPVIHTNTWTNLVDNTPPSATVTAPATSTTSSFTVTWSGADTTSGVANFDVLVATDGGPYVTWKQGVQAGSATYTGSLAHTYHFSAIAHDLAGNQSALPAVPSASTTVIEPPVPTTSPTPTPQHGPSAACVAAKTTVAKAKAKLAALKKHHASKSKIAKAKKSLAAATKAQNTACG